MHATLPAVGAAGILVALALSAADAPGSVGPVPPPREANALPAELQGAELIDSIVARVNRHPITHSQLEIEARLALAQHADLAAAEGPLTGAKLQSALEYLVDQILLDDEATHLQVFEITEEEGRAEVQKLASHFPSPQAYRAFLTRFAIAADLVEGSVRRALHAERYLDDKIRGQIQGGSDTAEAQAVAKEFMSQLRARADIRLVTVLNAPLPAPLGRSPAVPPPAASAVRP